MKIKISEEEITLLDAFHKYIRTKASIPVRQIGHDLKE
jgi:hypothetical protein